MFTLVRSLAFSVGLAAAAILATLSSPAAGAVSFFGSGTSSAGTPVAVQADLTLSGTTLTLVLSNVSPTPSVFADDVLSSFYFDIVKNGVRPTLNYTLAEGLVWQVRSDAPDLPINSEPSPTVGNLPTFTVATGTVLHVPSDLRGLKPIDQTWEFRPMDTTASPFLGFGLGTVANSLFAPLNGFDGDIVGPPGPDFIAFGIYKDSLVMPEGKPMNGQYLVRDTATFVFTSPELADYTPADIVPMVLFGLGTNPDTILTVPEPAGLAGLAAAGVGMAAWGVVRRRRRRAAATCRRKSRGFPTRLAAPVTSVTIVMALAVAGGGPASMPAVAELIPVDVVTYDFATGPSGWVAQNRNQQGTTSSPNIWQWTNPGGFWRVEPYPVLLTWVANDLTSPLITMPAATDLLEVTMRHRFSLPVTLDNPPKPIALGQVTYRVFDVAPLNPFNDPTPFLPIPASAWLDEVLEPPATALTPLSSTVLPTFEVPANLPPMIPGGMAFSGVSPGNATDDYVLSRFRVDGMLEPGQFVQLRFTNGNLGGICTGARWDVALVEVDGLLVPEPGGLALAAAGGIAAAAMGCLARRRLRHRPVEREPLTSGLRDRG